MDILIIDKINIDIFEFKYIFLLVASYISILVIVCTRPQDRFDWPFSSTNWIGMSYSDHQENGYKYKLGRLYLINLDKIEKCKKIKEDYQQIDPNCPNVITSKTECRMMFHWNRPDTPDVYERKVGILDREFPNVPEQVKIPLKEYSRRIHEQDIFSSDTQRHGYISGL